MLRYTATFDFMSTALLRPSEVGAQLGLSRATVYRLIAEGEFPTVHVGKRRATRIEQYAVDAYIARHTTARATA